MHLPTDTLRVFFAEEAPNPPSLPFLAASNLLNSNYVFQSPTFRFSFLQARTNSSTEVCLSN
jgi:hypothetical protein